MILDRKLLCEEKQVDKQAGAQGTTTVLPKRYRNWWIPYRKVGGILNSPESMISGAWSMQANSAIFWI